MKKIYPINIYKKDKGEKYHIVYIPDLKKYTQGEDLSECLDMARDLIGITWIDRTENGETLEEPFTVKDSEDEFNSDLEIEFKTLVDIDLLEYKKRLENKSVKKTLTIPYLLNQEGEKVGINFSRVLQEALEEKLSISR